MNDRHAMLGMPKELSNLRESLSVPGFHGLPAQRIVKTFFLYVKGIIGKEPWNIEKNLTDFVKFHPGRLPDNLSCLR
jgi:hypothetical protein